VHRNALSVFVHAQDIVVQGLDITREAAVVTTVQHVGSDRLLESEQVFLLADGGARRARRARNFIKSRVVARECVLCLRHVSAPVLVSQASR